MQFAVTGITLLRRLRAARDRPRGSRYYALCSIFGLLGTAPEAEGEY